MIKKIVYIAHPIGGNVEQNLISIRDIYERLTKENNVIPFAPYLEGFNFLSDSSPEERTLGMNNNLAFFERKSFDELWIFGDKISKGMMIEIRCAQTFDIPILIKSEMITNYLINK